MSTSNLLNQFETFIHANRLCTVQNKILIAVSGGIDSMVLADLFMRSNYKISIAHCNFQLREMESDLDAAFVMEFAQNKNIPFHTVSFDTLLYKLQHKVSLEVAARNLRYAWFEELRLNHLYDYIAVAHHLNDSIETVLINLVKGTGLKGLCGIPVKNKRIIRPLLFASRTEIETYAQSKSIVFRQDASNNTTVFVRNKIRHHIIPILKEINPAFENTFMRNMLHFKEAESIYSNAINHHLKKIIIEKENGIYISIKKFLNLNASATILFEFLKKYQFSEAQCFQIHQNLNGSGKQFLSSSHRVIVDRNYCILSTLQTQSNLPALIELKTKTLKTKIFLLKLNISNIIRKIKINPSRNIAYIDADQIEFPLVLRKWEAGDYFYPLGMMKKKNEAKRVRKKISNFLIDEKVNVLEKETTYVLCTKDKIIWVLGLRQDDRFKITPKTKRLLKIKMLPF